MKYQKEIKIGITVILAVAGVIWGVLFLKGHNMFANNRKFYAVYSDVSGLVPASPVFVNGLKVGQVASINIDKGNLNQLVVEFIVDNDNIIIPEDSKANLASADLFTKSIVLQLGKSSKLLKVGDTLVSSKQLSLQENVNAQIIPLKEKTQQLIGSIDSMVTIVTGVMGRNSGELDESFQSVRRAILNFESTAKNLDELIATEKGRISSIFGKVDNIAGSLSQSSGKITNTISNLSKISDTLANADIAGTVNKAKKTMDEIAKITEKINNGEGTMGALIKSDSLFNALVKTNDEIQRLVENMKDNPHRYVHFSVFGKREKGMKLDSRDQKKLKKMIDTYKETPATIQNGNN